MKKLTTILDEPKLLSEYGKAFYWINSAEALLRVSLEQSSGLYKIKRPLAKKILGAKIELAKHVLRKDLIIELRQMNENRKVLAHGLIQNISNLKSKRRIYRITHRTSKGKPISKEFTVKELKKISNQAKKVSDILFKDIEDWMINE